MPRILILNWRDMNNIHAGGAEVFAYQLAKRLARDGFAVTWLTSRNKGQSKDEHYDGMRIIRKGSWLSVYACAPIYFWCKLRKQTDVIIDCENGIPFFSPLYFSKKIICVIHHVHRTVFRHYSPNLFIKYCGILLESLIPAVYANAKMVAVSPSTKESMKTTLKFKGPVDIIYNGLNQYEFSPGQKSDMPLIIYFGRLKKYKRVEDVIEAMALLQPKVRHLKLIIAGEGEERENLVDLTKKLGLADCVSFEGYITEDRKKALLKEAWVLTYPSSHEGWGISVIEAAASGTCTIGSRVPGLIDSIQDGKTGILYEVSNTEALAQALYAVLTDSPRRALLEKNALQWSKRFDWEKSYRQLRSLIEQ